MDLLKNVNRKDEIIDWFHVRNPAQALWPDIEPLYFLYTGIEG